MVGGVDLEVNSGEVVGVLGRNGMGKSSLLGAIFGLVDRPGGSVEIGGTRIPARKPVAASRAGASFLPEDRGVFPSLTVAENLALAKRRGAMPFEPTEVFPMLGERARQAAGSLSGGQKQQLGVARTVLSATSLLAIDELTHGLQPSMVVETFRLLRRVADSGLGVLVIDQNPELITRHCDRVLVMEGGRVALEATVGDDTLDRVRGILALG
ncbi:ABC transporter ATP-binding protein [Pseudoclavibacter endophyticus]|uniref:ABC transporter ATP-binding protein n=1 Tax=Pseudoclavibacter endophyticus TaxID=1778590 RepID=UPI00166D346E|nr:ATP-binding cassette domain-containing protein [Pseudoclavibacter endophyticus]GGA67437.1 ABC transporter ATP-binding protein [Pseudoclavibacter endophyticus]